MKTCETMGFLDQVLVVAIMNVEGTVMRSTSTKYAIMCKNIQNLEKIWRQKQPKK